MGRRMIIWLLLAIIVVIFALQNVQNITLKFFFWELIEVPLPIVILLSLLLGVIAMALISWPKTYRLNRTIKKLNKRIEELEEETGHYTEDDNKEINHLGQKLEGDSNTKLFEDDE